MRTFGHILIFRRKCDPWSFLLFALAFCSGSVVGKPSNRTIDDEVGDSATGFKPLYSPPRDWVLGSTCPQKGCPVVLDPSKTLNGTWHETVNVPNDRYIHNITIQFTGIAIFVHGIVLNAYPNVTTITNMTFSLDQSDPEVYIHIPDSTSDILYQQLLYSKTNLSNANHVLVMAAQPASIAMFDYAEYTFDDGSESSPSTASTPTVSPTDTVSVGPSPMAEHSDNSSFPTGPVVGGVVGGVGGLSLVAVVFLLCYVSNRGLPRRLASAKSRWGDESFVHIAHADGIPLQPSQPPRTPSNSPTFVPEVIHVRAAVSDTDREVYPRVNPPLCEGSQASGTLVPPTPGSLSLRLDMLEVEVATLWDQHHDRTSPPQYAP